MNWKALKQVVELRRTILFFCCFFSTMCDIFHIISEKMGSAALKGVRIDLLLYFIVDSESYLKVTTNV